jgi:hypothetical protein
MLRKTGANSLRPAGIEPHEKICGLALPKTRSLRMNQTPEHRTWMRKAGLLAALAAALVFAPVPQAYGQSGSGTEQRESPAGAPSTEADAAAEPDEASAGVTSLLARGRKLILTDGSYQIVREYRREGERVRYYSMERSSWEEIPASLVDWPATEKAGVDSEAARRETLDRLHATATEEIAASLDTGSSLQVRQGVFLPDPAGFYVLDGQNVLTLHQTEGTSRLDKGRAILKGLSGIPLLSTKHNIEIPGKRSEIRVKGGEPEFFVRTVDGRNPELTVVKMSVDGDKRRVTTAVTDMVGNTKYDHNEVPTMTSEAARGVQRLTMAQPLTPGEYGIVEMTPQGLSLYVWDFGVDAAPSNSKANAKPSAK